MVLLLIAGVLAGFVTSISPCVLPVLPIVLTAGTARSSSSAESAETSEPSVPSGRRRPVLVVAGLVVSFAVTTLLGSLVLSALGLPQDLLRDIGIAVLIVIGIGLLVPKLGALIERPFARLTSSRVPRGNGFGLGAGLGLLYVPCAGPILATIAVVGATHHIGWRAVLLTIAFAIGAGVPLLVVALAGEAAVRRVAALRRRAGVVRMGSGLVMIAVAVLVAFDVTDGLQTHVPGYTSAAQRNIESGSQVSGQLAKVRGQQQQDLGGRCTEGGAALENCGSAPAFTGISSWLNTPGDRPLTMSGLRGKVVLVDFWTYSCINCRRAIPHVEAWYRKYAKDGLEVVGVHTPEFAFEHVRSNVVSGARGLDVTYPVAIDNDYDTWNAYGNQYWPSQYLIDTSGHVRHVSYGEGGYGTTEKLIRSLLAERTSHSLGASTKVPSASLSSDQTPEMHLGAKYRDLNVTPGQRVSAGTAAYRLPGSVDPSTVALGGTWTQDTEYLQAVRSSVLQLRYRGRHAYLVLGGSGTVDVSFDGKHSHTVRVTGVPTLYELASTPEQFGEHLLSLSVTPGVQAYAFTFG